MILEPHFPDLTDVQCFEEEKNVWVKKDFI